MIDSILNIIKAISDVLYNLTNFFVNLGILLFWLYMFVDLITRKEEDMGNYFRKYSKWIWFVILLIFNGVGALFYFFLVYSKTPKSGNFDVWKSMKDMAKKVEDKVFSEEDAKEKVSDAEIVK